MANAWEEAPLVEEAGQPAWMSAPIVEPADATPPYQPDLDAARERGTTLTGAAGLNQNADPAITQELTRAREDAALIQRGIDRGDYGEDVDFARTRLAELQERIAVLEGAGGNYDAAFQQEAGLPEQGVARPRQRSGELESEVRRSQETLPETVRRQAGNLGRSALTTVAAGLKGMGVLEAAGQDAQQGTQFDPEDVDARRAEIEGYKLVLETQELSPEARQFLEQNIQTLEEGLYRMQGLPQPSERRTRATGMRDEGREMPSYKAGQRLEDYANETFGPRDPHDKSFSSQVSEGLGSFLGFLGTTAAATAAGGPVGGLIAGGGFGAAANAGQLYDEAKAAGVDEGTARSAAGWGALIGSTEVLPIAHMIERVGGPALEAGSRIWKRMVSASVEAGEEATQEGFQGRTNNEVTQRFIDPRVGDWEGVGSGAAVGAITGGGVQMVMPQGLGPREEPPVDAETERLRAMSPVPREDQPIFTPAREPTYPGNGLEMGRQLQFGVAPDGTTAPSAEEVASSWRNPVYGTERKPNVPTPLERFQQGQMAARIQGLEPGDLASPIPNDVLARGKAILKATDKFKEGATLNEVRDIVQPQPVPERARANEEKPADPTQLGDNEELIDEVMPDPVTGERQPTGRQIIYNNATGESRVVDDGTGTDGGGVLGAVRGAGPARGDGADRGRAGDDSQGGAPVQGNLEGAPGSGNPARVAQPSDATSPQLQAAVTRLETLANGATVGRRPDGKFDTPDAATPIDLNAKRVERAAGATQTHHTLKTLPDGFVEARRPDGTVARRFPPGTPAELSAAFLQADQRATELEQQYPTRARPETTPKRGLMDRLKGAFGIDAAAVERTPELQEAARKVAAGEMTQADYQKVVDQHKPVLPYEAVPEPATPADLQRGLTADKAARIGAPDRLEPGHKVGLRLDIPAYTDHGVWAVSVHEQQPGFAAGPSIGYTSAARVQNATMGVVPKAALSIAQGKPKSTIATIKGDWVKTTPEEAKALADEALNDPAWVQVGMDPERHQFFYDRKTQQPVTAAEDVVQIGPLVLAKNPTYGKAADFQFATPAPERGAEAASASSAVTPAEPAQAGPTPGSELAGPLAALTKAAEAMAKAADAMAGRSPDASAVGLRTGEENLDVTQKDTRGVAEALQRRARQLFGRTAKSPVIARTDRSQAAAEKIGGWIAEEVLHEVEVAKQTPGKTAVGWYSTKFQAALEIIGREFPELNSGAAMAQSNLPGVQKLRTQKNARDFLTALIAVSSDGNRPYDNFKMAKDVYALFRETGTLDGTPIYGQRQKAIRGNVQFIQKLLDQYGPEGMHEELMREGSVSELVAEAKRRGAKLNTKYPKDMKLPYAALTFGPKLGAFYANLMGAEGYLTMDRWFSRTFNRYRGDLVTQPRKAGMDRVRGLLAKDKGVAPETLSDTDVLGALAPYVKAYSDKGWKNGTELEVAANTLFKDAFLNLNDTPFSTKDRDFMVRSVVAGQAALERSGVEMSIADIQAVLWYFEKRLYAEMGAKDSKDVSYEEIARRLVEGDRPAGPGRKSTGRRRQSSRLPSDDVGPSLNLDSDPVLQPDGPDASVVLDRGTDGGQPYAPLPGAPRKTQEWGPDPRIVGAAEAYAKSVGIDLKRQASYAKADPAFGARVAQAYALMKHDPANPRVKRAYEELIRQTRAQYDALTQAGFSFYFYDGETDPYGTNPWAALRDLRDNQRMAVFSTVAGYGSGAQVNIGLADPKGGPDVAPETVIAAVRGVGGQIEDVQQFTSDSEPTLVFKLKKPLTKEQGDALSETLGQEAIAQRYDSEEGDLFGPMAEKWGPYNPDYFVTLDGRRASEVANPLLVDTGLQWPHGGPDGPLRPVLANDLFRAVHDAFGHSLEGVGFRADGEENAWQAHVRLFYGDAVGAMTSETRGQNSWLNFGPYGEANRTAGLFDTVFADQKTGLMPEWTWTENRVGDMDPDAAVIRGTLLDGPAGKAEYELSDDLLGKADRVQKRLQALGQKLKLPDFTVAVAERLFVENSKLPQGRQRVEGLYFGRVILVALQAGRSPERLFRHEVMHFFRDPNVWGQDFGLFKPSEWAALVKAARATPGLQAQVEEAYPRASREKQEEEMVAALYEQWWQDQRDQGFVGKAFARLRDFLSMVRQALNLEGFTTADQVFRRMESGRIGSRGQNVDAGGESLISAAAPAPVFYSPVARAARGAKQAKAPAGDWIAILKKEPGVKDAELEWLGVKDWLAAQKGQVTRDDLAAFIASQQVYLVTEIGTRNHRERPDLDTDFYEGDDGEDAFAVIDNNSRTFGESVVARGTFENGVWRLGRREFQSREEMLQWVSGSLDTRQQSDFRAKWEDYSEPGGENYREMILRVPNLHESGPNRSQATAWRQELNQLETIPIANRSQEQWARIHDILESISAAPGKTPFVHSQHFRQENVVVHARMKDRVGPNGERVLFIEEVQSDLSSQWRKNKPNPEEEAKRAALEEAEAKALTEAMQIGKQIEDRLLEKWTPNLKVYDQGELRSVSKEGWERFVTGGFAVRAAAKIGASGSLQEAIQEQLQNGAAPLDEGFDSAADIVYIMAMQDPELLQLGGRHAVKMGVHDAARNELLRMGSRSTVDKTLPQTPFPEELSYQLMARRLARLAADEGYDMIAWTSGAMQARRWNTEAEDVLESVEWGPTQSNRAIRQVAIHTGGYSTQTVLVDADGVVFNASVKDWDGQKLADLVSPPIAARIMAEENGTAEGREFAMPNTGYAIAYDVQLRSAMERIGKKHGVRVESRTDFEDFMPSGNELDYESEQAAMKMEPEALIEKLLEADLIDGDYAQELAQWSSSMRGQWDSEVRSRQIWRKVKVNLPDDTTFEGAVKRVFNVDREGKPIWTMRLPESLREAAMQAQPMFAMPVSIAAMKKAHRAAMTGTSPYLPSVKDWVQLMRAASSVMDRVRFGKQAAIAAVDAARLYLQDSMLPVKRAQQVIERQIGAPIPADENLYMAETTYSGRVGRHLWEIDEDYVKPIVRLMADHKIDPDLAGQYLYALHAPERNAHIQRIDPKAVTGSGMTDADAAAFIATIPPQKRMVLQQIARHVQRLRDRNIDLALRSGLIDTATATQWRLYQHYVPLKGFADLDHAEAFGAGKKFNVQGPESKRALGRESEAFNPLQMAITDAQMMAIRAEKNVTLQALWNLANAHPADRLWQVKTPAKRKVFNKSTGMVEYHTEPITARSAANEFAIKVGGEEKRVILPDTRLAKALGAMNADSLGGVFRLMSMGSQFFSMTRTMLNPAFWVLNAPRDAMTAMVNLGAFAGSDANYIRGQIIKSYIPALLGTVKGMAGNTTDPWARAFHDFQRAGAHVSFWRMEDPQANLSDLKLRVYLAEGGKVTRARKIVTTPKAFFSVRDNPVIDLTEKANLAIDNSIRLVVFKAAMDRGWSAQEAANLSKELTVNFNRKGTMGPQLNALFPFFNAAIQGSTILLRAAGHKSVRRAILAMVAAGFVNDLLNAALSDDDDTGEKLYDLVPDYRSQRAFHIVGWGDGSNPLAIPMPYGFNIFPYIGQQAGKVARGVKPWDEAMLGVFEASLQAFSPINGNDWQNTMAPYFADPAVDILQNENSFESPIYPRFPDEFLPDAFQAFDSASNTSKWIAPLLNRATGGDGRESGWWDWSPETFDYVAAYVTGGTGTFFGRLDDLRSKIMAGQTDDIALQNVPILNSLTSPVNDWVYTSRFYEFAAMVDNAVEDMKGYKEGAQGEPSPETRRLARLGDELEAARHELKGQAEYNPNTPGHRQQRPELKVYQSFIRRYLRVMGPQAE